MVAATVSARPSKFRVIVNGIKWLCGMVGAKLRSWWPPLAPGVSIRVPLPRNNGGYEEKRVDRVLETQAAPGEPTSQGLASRHE